MAMGKFVSGRLNNSDAPAFQQNGQIGRLQPERRSAGDPVRLPGPVGKRFSAFGFNFS